MVQYQSQPGRTRREMATGVYLGVLSRFPTGEELKVVEDYSSPGSANSREVGTDLVWALINSPEFLFRH